MSWLTILKRREGYRKVFANFDVKKVSKFSITKIEKLLLDRKIIRNRLKITSAIHNAKLFVEIQKEFGSFYKYSMQFVGGKQKINKRRKMKDYPSKQKSLILSVKILKKEVLNLSDQLLSIHICKHAEWLMTT